MPNYAALADEINTDPLGRGYSTMSDQEIADSLNAVDRVVSVASIESQDVVAALDPADFGGLTAAEQRYLWGIIGAGAIRPDDTEVKAFFLSIFGAGTNTRANLGALANKTISRAEEVGLGEVNFPTVNIARALNR